MTDQSDSLTGTRSEFPRRHDLDALRAFAMLLGIALHGALSFVPFPWPVQDSQQNGLFGLFFAAVHGFRMPLFFLVSGFFTAMLWRRRGLKSLIWHRFRRVFLPLMLGLLTVVPAVTWISGKAMQTAGNAGSSAEQATGLIAAVRTGDVDAVRRELDNGSDVDAFDPTFGVTPLAWAAMRGDAAVVALLIENDADVDASNRDGGTALHGAAFLGHADVVEMLIDRGADVNVRNKKQETPLDVSAVDWGATQFVAGLLAIELDDEQAVREGRNECRRLLGSEAVTELPLSEESLDGDAGGMRAAYLAWLSSDRFSVEGDGGESFHLFFTPVFHHLWFLWFLCWLVPIFAAFALTASAVKGEKAPLGLVLSPLRFLWLLPLTMLPQWFMGILIPSFGPDTSAGILPQPHLLAYYGVFFGFGALYYQCDDREGRLGRWWWLTLPLAVFVVLPVGLIAMGNRPVTGVAQVIYVWAMTFGLIGLFRSLLTRENGTIRYVSDSSYWLYVAHLPLIMGAQALVRDWPLPAMVKFILVCGVVTAFLLLTYQTVVRYTWLGRLLNGPRKRPEPAMDVVFFNSPS